MTEKPLFDKQWKILMAMDGKIPWANIPWDDATISHMDDMVEMGYLRKDNSDSIETWLLTEKAVEVLKERYEQNDS